MSFELEIDLNNIKRHFINVGNINSKNKLNPHGLIASSMECTVLIKKPLNSDTFGLTDTISKSISITLVLSGESNPAAP